MVTITATFGGKSSQAVLTVNPQPTYDGTYSGTYSGFEGATKVSGLVTATVSNGTVTVTEPATGNGTVSTSGQIAFGVVIDGTTSCNFNGQITLVGTGASGSGNFSCSGPSISGSWTVARQ
jgi:hypothetical protein